MTDHARLTPVLARLPRSTPFIGPEELERRRGRPFRARLGANECGFGPSPRAVAAMEAEAREIWKYGDSTCHDLREALAAHHGVAPAQIVIGEGIDGLLGVLARLVVGPGDKVVTSLGAYPTFNFHVAGLGGDLVTVPYAADHEDPDALISRAAEVAAKLVYFCNPDNPMGTWHDAARVRAMVDAVPAGTLMILDEAYIDFAPEGTAPDIDAADDRVIRMRTFSKAYGMAGARIGYAIGPEPLIAAFDLVRNHFGVNRVAQAGALAALADRAHLARVTAEVAQARARIAAIGRDNSLTPMPSAASFVALDCGRDGGFARAVLEELAARDVFVRMPGAAPMDRCIRVSAGPAPELDVFAAALPEALAAALTARRG